MFATAEEKIIVAALGALLLLVGILGYNHHERSEGAAICVQQDTKASDTQHKKDMDDAQETITNLRAQLVTIPSVAPAATPMRLCNIAPSRVPQRPASTGVESAKLPDSGNGGSVQAGTESSVDIGPSVQDIALSCVLGVTDAQDLWNLALKEASP